MHFPVLVWRSLNVGFSWSCQWGEAGCLCLGFSAIIIGMQNRNLAILLWLWGLYFMIFVKFRFFLQNLLWFRGRNLKIRYDYGYVWRKFSIFAMIMGVLNEKVLWLCTFIWKRVMNMGVLNVKVLWLWVYFTKKCCDYG